MADTFLVSFVACLLAAIVFFNGLAVYSRIKYWLRNKFFPVEGICESIGGSAGSAELFSESMKMHEARSELDIAVLDLTYTDAEKLADAEERLIDLAHAYRATISENQERRLRALHEFQKTMYGNARIK